MLFLDGPHLFTFTIATLALLVIPGPAMLYIVTRSLEGGVKTGLASVFGIFLGGLIHVIGAALGLSAILMSSATAFLVVKYIGATYLIYLGLSKILKNTTLPSNLAQPTKVQATLSKIFWQGFIVEIFNPKAALFFLSFLPQFTVPEKGHLTLQIISLGVLFLMLAFVTDSFFALFSGSLRPFLQQTKTSFHFRNRLTGLVYLGLGVFTAFYEPNKKIP